MPGTRYDPTASAPMTAIVRIAVVAVTAALFFSSSFNALIGNREISIVLALATPLGLSAWGFARAGHNEAAMVLLCLVLVTVVTLILVLSPLGVHDLSVTAYGGVVLVGALLLSRRSFVAVVAVTALAASGAFLLDRMGASHSEIAQRSGWPQLVNLLIVTSGFAVLGRAAAEQLFGSLGEAHRAAQRDPVTRLKNRAGFIALAGQRLQAARAREECGVLVVADLDGFRRINLVIGHDAGDVLLREAARRLSAVAGEGHLIGRLGDDEFAVLALAVPEERAEPFARELHRALDFDFQGASLRNAAGYARFPRDAHGIAALLLAAESSLVSSKEKGGERLAGPGNLI